MPHVIVEYSGNLRDEIESAALLAALARAVLGQRDARGDAVFPLGGLRARATGCDEYLIADGSSQFGFVHVVLKIGSGRTEAVEAAAAAAAFDALKTHMQAILRKRPLSLSLELQRFSEALSFKHNTVHGHLRDRNAESGGGATVLTDR